MTPCIWYLPNLICCVVFWISFNFFFFIPLFLILTLLSLFSIYFSRFSLLNKLNFLIKYSWLCLPHIAIWCWRIPERLRILTRKKHPQLRLQRFQKLWIWTFGWLVHQINSLYEVLKLKQIFVKTKLVTGKNSFFMIGPFCTPHSICLGIGFWQSSFVAFSILVLSTKKTVLQFFEKGFRFSENLFQS